MSLTPETEYAIGLAVRRLRGALGDLERRIARDTVELGNMRRALCAIEARVESAPVTETLGELERLRVLAVRQGAGGAA
jgi:hypothetical protein